MLSWRHIKEMMTDGQQDATIGGNPAVAESEQGNEMNVAKRKKTKAPSDPPPTSLGSNNSSASASAMLVGFSLFLPIERSKLPNSS
jgi:hypothetical protein